MLHRPRTCGCGSVAPVLGSKVFSAMPDSKTGNPDYVKRKRIMKRIICAVVLTGFVIVGPLTAASLGDPQANKKAVKQDIKNDKRDVKADRAELNRLRTDLNAPREAGDRARIARDETAIQKLEADMKADRGDIAEDKAEAKAAGKHPKKGKS